MLLNDNILTVIKKALKEDIGKYDITTNTIVPSLLKGKARIIAKEKGILCGIDVVGAVFRLLDKNIYFKPLKKDGDIFKAKDVIAKIEGNFRAILTSERLALNFLSILSGISTTTRDFLKKIKGMKTKIMDTRKTTPNLRELEKYAVRVGGGWNHRKNLQEGVIIKDNHLKATGCINKDEINENKIAQFITILRKNATHKVEIEVENLREFYSVIKQKPDIIMLDNFSLKDIGIAVKYRNTHFPKVKLEASGRINLNNVKKFAQKGLDYISIGLLTHSPSTIDFSLEIF
ncbi:MAG: carboxylating nicotinate-nucleotide diphosphorylase [Candidatus Omnitrophica bacterium]|nr:carboxylating nicotinate-nucleotide diphosphorylase [Candidatus Omnitrophota bacterium]